MTEQAFVCESCGQECISDRTNDEAMKEYEGKYGSHMGEEIGVICEDCAIDFDKWFDTQRHKL